MKKVLPIVFALLGITALASCDIGPMNVAEVQILITTAEFSDLYGKDLYVSSENVASYSSSKSTLKTYMSTEHIPLYLDKKLKNPSGYFFCIEFTFDSTNRLLNNDYIILNERDEELWRSGYGHDTTFENYTFNEENTMVTIPSHYCFGLGATNKGNVGFHTLDYVVCFNLSPKGD